MGICVGLDPWSLVLVYFWQRKDAGMAVVLWLILELSDDLVTNGIDPTPSTGGFLVNQELRGSE